MCSLSATPLGRELVAEHRLPLFDCSCVTPSWDYIPVLDQNSVLDTNDVRCNPVTTSRVGPLLTRIGRLFVGKLQVKPALTGDKKRFKNINHVRTSADAGVGLGDCDFDTGKYCTTLISGCTCDLRGRLGPSVFAEHHRTNKPISRVVAMRFICPPRLSQC